MAQKIFTELDLQNNKIFNVFEIRSTDGVNTNNTGIIISTKGKSGIHTSNTDGGLIVDSEHFSNNADTYNITNATVTTLVSPSINIKSNAEKPNQEIDISESTGTVITSNSFKLKASNDEIITFINKDDSTINITNANTVTEVISTDLYVGTKTSSSLHTSTSLVDVTVPLNIKGGTAALNVGLSDTPKNSTFYGDITQNEGNVTINTSDKSTVKNTTIKGNEVTVQPTTVTVGVNNTTNVSINGSDYLSITSGTDSQASCVKSSEFKVGKSANGDVRIYTSDNSLIFEKIQ